MTDQFNPGDIVYHKVNNLRMVVLSITEIDASCQYVTSSGIFFETKFKLFQLSKTPISTSDAPVITQLEMKKS